MARKCHSTYSTPRRDLIIVLVTVSMLFYMFSFSHLNSSSSDSTNPIINLQSQCRIPRTQAISEITIARNRQLTPSIPNCALTCVLVLFSMLFYLLFIFISDFQLIRYYWCLYQSKKSISNTQTRLIQIPTIARSRQSSDSGCKRGDLFLLFLCNKLSF